MPIIEVITEIEAPIEACFDLARCIEFHQDSCAYTGEQAVAGVTSGLIGHDETVTWRARHFGVWFTLTSRITGYDRPRYFQDSMISGPFARLVHDHHFEERDGKTVMTDRFLFESLFGPLGVLADRLFLENHLRGFIEHRNAVYRELLESGAWRQYITDH